MKTNNYLWQSLIVALVALVVFGGLLVDASQSEPQKTNLLKGRPLLLKNQVALLIKTIKNRPESWPAFSRLKFPVLYELRQSSYVLNQIRRSFQQPLDEYEREQLSKFPFFTEKAHQLRALLVYPWNSNRYSRPEYIRWVRETLPLFCNPKNWPRLWFALDVLKTVKERLPAIFIDETEEALHNQYCAYQFSAPQYHETLKFLLPAIRLERTFEQCLGWEEITYEALQHLDILDINEEDTLKESAETVDEKVLDQDVNSFDSDSASIGDYWSEVGVDLNDSVNHSSSQLEPKIVGLEENPPIQTMAQPNSSVNGDSANIPTNVSSSTNNEENGQVVDERTALPPQQTTSSQEIITVLFIAGKGQTGPAKIHVRYRGSPLYNDDFI